MNSLEQFNKRIPSSAITDIVDIKLLLCYIFFKIGSFVSKDVLSYALQEHNFVNYFDFNNAFSELLKDGSIAESENDKGSYFVTQKGNIIAKELEKRLPLTVRERALAATINLLAKLKRENENSSKIKKTDAGYCVNGNISGGGGINLMSFSLYVPDESQAKLIKKNFQSCPEKVYECMLAVLTKDRDIVCRVLEKFKED